jgi:hypothetical protein
VTTKQKGKCPFCGNTVQAEIVEENTIRRDKCQCPECKELLFVCRTPGCHDYAKGTETYDHELCPDCTSKVADAASSTGSLIGKAAVTAVGIIVTAAAKSAFDKGKKK